MVEFPAENPKVRPIRIAARGGITLAGDELGPATGAPVLLLHGFGQTRRAWRDTARALAGAGYRVLAPDARGHGESGHADDGDYRLDDFVDDVRRLCEYPGKPPVLVGASMGGLTGLLAEAESDRRRIAALVLVDIAPRWDEAGVSRILAFMRARPEGFASLEEAASAVAEYLPHREPRRTARGLQPYLRETSSGRLVWHWDPNLLSQFGAESAPYHARLMAAARLLTCPALLISGELSEVVSDEDVTEFLQAVPHAGHVSIPGATHMVAGDRNDAFTEAVLDFIESLDGPNAARGSTAENRPRRRSA